MNFYIWVSEGKHNVSEMALYSFIQDAGIGAYKLEIPKVCYMFGISSQTAKRHLSSLYDKKFISYRHGVVEALPLEIPYLSADVPRELVNNLNNQRYEILVYVYLKAKLPGRMKGKLVDMDIPGTLNIAQRTLDYALDKLGDLIKVHLIGNKRFVEVL